jgi:glycosyltransferase involved in cell wall biosynthesis
MRDASISVVVITKNEEKKIRRCLSSVASFASEIIVVDDESGDRTTDIARNEFNAKVIVHGAGGNFDGQRNLGINTASGPWIFQMDADEEVPSGTAAAIKRAAESAENLAAFRLVRRDCVFGEPLRHAGKDKQVKLFKKDKARYTGGKIHETIEVDGNIKDLRDEVLHYNFDSIQEVLSRWNYYTDVESSAYVRSQGPQKLKALKKRLLYKSFKLFYKHYVKHGAFKDGARGLVWAVLHVLSPLLFWLKVLEKSLKDGKLA